MLENLKEFVRKQQFCPTGIGLLINPFYLSRKGLYKEIKLLSPLVYGSVLDVGCGRKPYAHLFNCEK